MLAFCTMMDEQPDRDAFEEMYYRYRGMVYQTAWDVLHDHFLAEDAAMQTFWKAAEHFETVSHSSEPQKRRFLAIVARRTAINLYHKRRRESCLSLEELEVELPDRSTAVRPEEEGTLGAAMARLPQSYLEVLLLRYTNGYEVREIADMLSSSEAAVYKTIARAKKKLEQYLREEETE